MYKELKKCLCCENKSLKTILNLNKQPLANSYYKKGEILEEYPLAVNLCNNCFHLQLTYSVDPDLMFKNYLYVSGTSKTLRDYFDHFANLCLKNSPEAKTILDIACNDGSQLNSFAKLGLETFGIDPATNLYEISTKNNHKVICGYLDNKTKDKLISDFNKSTFDIITAQNVFAHNNDPYNFLLSCKNLMNDDTKLYIQTSQAKMIVNNQFDTIYHEHISFFNINSMKKIVERAGLHLNDVYLADIHGISYVFTIGKTSTSKSINVTKSWVEEDKEGIYTNERYDKYVNSCNKVVLDLKEKVEQLKDQGYIIAGYGAAAKGVVLLNYSKIKLDFVVDDNPMKHNLMMPGTETVIFPPEELNKYSSQKIAILPLAWNFFEEIKSKTIKIMNRNDVPFVKYFPEVKLC